MHYMTLLLWGKKKKGQKEIDPPKMAGSGFGFVCTAKEKELLMFSK